MSMSLAFKVRSSASILLTVWSLTLVVANPRLNLVTFSNPCHSDQSVMPPFRQWMMKIIQFKTCLKKLLNKLKEGSFV
jgi:hypothetical protein